MQLAIPAELAQALLDYLSKQPYREVYHMIPQIQNLPKVETQSKADQEPEHAPSTPIPR